MSDVVIVSIILGVTLIGCTYFCAWAVIKVCQLLIETDPANRKR